MIQYGFHTAIASTVIATALIPLYDRVQSPPQSSASTADPAWMDLAVWGRLKRGMTVEEVKAILGSPTMENGFAGEAVLTYMPIDPASQADMAKVLDWTMKDPNLELPSGSAIFQSGKLEEWTAPEAAHLERLAVLQGRSDAPKKAGTPAADARPGEPAAKPSVTQEGSSPGDASTMRGTTSIPAWMREDVWDRVLADPSISNVRHELGRETSSTSWRLGGFTELAQLDTGTSGPDVRWEARPSPGFLRGVAIADKQAGRSLPKWLAPAVWVDLCQALGGHTVDEQARARRVTGEDVLALLGEPTLRTMKDSDADRLVLNRRDFPRPDKTTKSPMYWIYEMPGVWNRPVAGLVRFRDAHDLIVDAVIAPMFDGLSVLATDEFGSQLFEPHTRVERLKLAVQTPRWDEALRSQALALGRGDPQKQLELPSPDRIAWTGTNGAWTCTWHFEPEGSMAWQTLVPASQPQPASLEIDEAMLVNVTIPNLSITGVDRSDLQKVEKIWGRLVGIARRDDSRRLGKGHAVWHAVAMLGKPDTKSDWSPASGDTRNRLRSVWMWRDLCEVEFEAAASGKLVRDMTQEHMTLWDLYEIRATVVRVTPVGAAAATPPPLPKGQHEGAIELARWGLIAPGDTGAWVLRLLGEPIDTVDAEMETILVYPGWKDSRGTWAGGRVSVVLPPRRKALSNGEGAIEALVVKGVVPPIIVGRP